MNKSLPLALAMSASLLLASGCASTTTPCAPQVVRPMPPESLLVMPRQPVLLIESRIDSTSGTSLQYMPKTPSDGPSAAASSKP